MSEQKMREALERLAAYPYGRNDELGVAKMRSIAREALAQQPAAVVELTKCEGCNGHGEVGGLLPGDGGYESNPCPFCQPVAVELTDYELNDISMLKTGYPITVLGRVLARAVIAAHEKKREANNA